MVCCFMYNRSDATLALGGQKRRDRQTDRQTDRHNGESESRSRHADAR